MQINIEKASASDAAEVLKYLRQVGSETDNLTFGAEGLPFSIEAEAQYLTQIENSRDEVMFLAKADSQIVGIASLSRLPRRMNHRGELAISVMRSHWNRGIGSRLMEQLITFAKKNAFEFIDLQVRSDNCQAIHLYEKYGFQKLCTHPAFFKVDGVPVAFDYMYLQLL